MSFLSAKSLPRWRTDVFLAAAMTLNYADRSVLPVIFPALRQDLALSDVAFGLLGSLFLWSYAICGPVSGMLADRYSRRIQVVVSLFAWSVATALTGAVNGFIMLAVLRIALGISESLYLPASIALLADHHGPTTRGWAMGVQSFSGSVGVILGGACAGYVAERYGWRWSFGILGFTGIAIALVARQFLGAPPATSRPVDKPRIKVGEALAYLVRVPTFLLLLAETVLAGVAVWIFFNWLPLYLYETHGMKMGAAGFAGMAMLQGSTMLGIVVGAWFSDRAALRAQRNRLLIFGTAFLLAAPCLLSFLFLPSYPVVALAVSVFSFLRAVGAVNELPILCDVIPQPFRSTAVGIFVACACVGGGAGTLVAAYLKQSVGLAMVFAGLSAVFALAGFALLMGYRRLIGRDVARATAWTEAQST